MKKVYFDESGNTGQNLLDEADPVFVLASCSFEAEEELKLLSHFERLRQFKLPELKFTSLRRSPAGRNAVLEFLRSESVHCKSAAVVVTHKPFMVVTKYCDLVLEPSMRSDGIDFYQRGLNIATANLLATTMPTFLNPATWNNFLSLFVRVMRERTPSVVNDWCKSAELIYAHLDQTKPFLARFFAPVRLMCESNSLFELLSEHELDPLPPAYLAAANHWGNILGEQYDIIADESKVLAKECRYLLDLSDQNLKSFSAGYDCRRMNLPLKVADVVSVDSTAFRQVQFADVLCGAIAGTLKAGTKSRLETGAFECEVLDLLVEKKLIITATWPTRVVDPAVMGTDTPPGHSDFDLPTYTAMVLQGHPSTKKSTQ